MQKLNLIQGSPEWLEARENHFCASDAPAMMGESKYKSRNKLLDQFKGVKEEITPAMQKLFDRGHETEERAREILEIRNLMSFDACVYVDFDGDLLASLDGLNPEGTVIFEHKLWNETLAENVRNNVLEPTYYWQLEHQLYVTKAEKVIFVVSDGTTNNWEQMIYISVPERREALLKGWAQFKTDLAKHEVKAKVEKVEAESQALPALTINVSGSEITTNLKSCVEIVKQLAEKEISKVLETDQDFANKEQLNKDVKKARTNLKEKIQSVKTEFVSYAEFEELAKELDSALQKMQSDGEKKVKLQKEERKKKIIEGGLIQLTEICKEYMDDIEKHGIYFTNLMRQVINEPFKTHDFKSVVKNKRTLDSIQNAVDSHTAEIKIKINAAWEIAWPNFDYLIENVDINKYGYLFSNMLELISIPKEAFKTSIDSTIQKQLEAEAAERKRIEQEAIEKERARVEREESQRQQAQNNAVDEAFDLPKPSQKTEELFEKAMERKNQSDILRKHNKNLLEEIESLCFRYEISEEGFEDICNTVLNNL